MCAKYKKDEHSVGKNNSMGFWIGEEPIWNPIFLLFMTAVYGIPICFLLMVILRFLGEYGNLWVGGIILS